MLLCINPKTRFAERKRTEHLGSFGLDERALQDILFKSHDRLFPDDELILLMQSRAWQEEPDLMAVDKDGNLYIFELKVWESHASNLLQVLRYGQMYGGSRYADLNGWYQKVAGQPQDLKAAHRIKFGVEISEEDFNRKQVFMVVTNGLDYRTREAIQYWRRSRLDVRPWVYRVYRGNANEVLLEISAFRVHDNPYEDLAEGYYILNTNISNSQEDHDDMLRNAKAAAYSDPWKFNIERLAKGDVVFLFQTGVGVVALGEADGKVQKRACHWNPEDPEAEYFMKLLQFRRVSPPLKAAEVKNITGINYRFMSTMFGLDAESGGKIRKFLHDEGRLKG
jgi:hypothetical protein